MRERSDVLAGIREGLARGERLALATVVSVQGSAYRRPGARMLLGPEGPRCGCLSGGCLEAEIQARAAELLPGERRLLRYDLRGDLDLIWGTGSGCEGVAEILLEQLSPDARPAWVDELSKAEAGRRDLRLATVLQAPEGRGLHLGERRVLAPGEALPEGVRALVEDIPPPIALWCLGMGDDARPLVAFAQALGWSVGLADHRPAFANPARFPGVRTILCGRPAETVPCMALDARSACVLLTHHWERDGEALKRLLPSPAAYVGLLGHRRRSERLLAQLRFEGFEPSAEQLARLHAPVGLDLGGEGPEAIALAVVAEIQSVMTGRSAAPLRGRSAPIHG